MSSDARPPVPGRMAAGALHGIRVLDTATLFAGPTAATLLADFGADVIKIEHPSGDPARTHGRSKDGVALWWKSLARNKRAITLNLSHPDGREVMLKLIETADVWVENFRPGTLEKWGYDRDTLFAINPRLVLARVSGFGQNGPYAKRSGFGTLAEALSGFADMTGPVDGPPTLPPFGLADGVAGLATAFAIMTALTARQSSGRGQVIDISLIEPLMSILGPQVISFDQLGIRQKRSGNRSDKNAPRNTYLTSDGRWVALSTSSTSIAERVMILVGWPEVTAEPWFKSAAGRLAHADELDQQVANYIQSKTLAEVLESFEQAQAAIAPIYDIEDIFADPHFNDRGIIAKVADPDLGRVAMQDVIFKLDATPGQIRWTGRALGADTVDVLKEVGLTSETLVRLKASGAI